MSIISLMNQIKNKELVLPATQRDFVWSDKQILKLLDSVMRGYSVGITLIWETYDDIQYRPFVSNYRQDNLLNFRNNKKKKRIRLVLDGQQRLQSLYLALYGTIEGESLIFDVLSGKDNDDLSQAKYVFYFGTADEIEEWNEFVSNADYTADEDYSPEWYVKVSDIFKLSSTSKKALVRDIRKKLNLSNDDSDRLSVNLDKFDDVFYKEENILKSAVIDENLPSDNPERKSEAEVLEMFVRINTGGTKLGRSDLIFSMLKLNWKEAASNFPEFVKEINTGNDFDLDEDFIIRCLFVISNLGSKFDVSALRKKSDIKKLKDNFEDCCKAIRATVDFVNQQCWCASSDIIGNYYNLVPFVYYLFHSRNHVIPNSQVDRVRKAFFLFAFVKPFSRHADSRLRKFTNDYLKPLADNDDSTFPLEDTISWLAYYEGIMGFDKEVLKRNVPLTLHLIQGLSGGKVKYEQNLPEIDHIFPKSTLIDKGYDIAEYNHFANYWILAKNKNRNKTNRHPKEYFLKNNKTNENVSASELKRALIDPNMLDFRKYSRFINVRGDKILRKVKAKIGFSDKDFKVLNKD